MNISKDGRNLFSLMADQYKQQPELKSVSLQKLTRNFKLTQDEFVLTVSVLQTNGLIKVDPNFTEASLTDKGRKNINYIKVP